MGSQRKTTKFANNQRQKVKSININDVTHSKFPAVTGPMRMAPEVMIVQPLNLSMLSPLMESVSTLLRPAHSV